MINAKDIYVLKGLMKNIIELCEKVGVSLEHEDCHGSFVFTHYNVKANEHFLDALTDIQDTELEPCDQCNGSGVYYLNDEPQQCICIGG